MLIEQLIRVAETYAEYRGLSLARVSTLFLDQGGKLERIKAGQSDLTTRIYERVMAEFSRQWPADLEWPDKVKRPGHDDDTAKT